MLDLLYPTEYRSAIREGHFKVISSTEIVGYADTRIGSSFDYTLYFTIRFNKPIQSFSGWQGQQISHNVSEWTTEGDCGGFVTFDVAKGESIMMQVGISLVDAEGSRKNLDSEMQPYGWNFDAVRGAAKEEWNALLSKIEVEGSEENKREVLHQFLPIVCQTDME